MVVVLSLFVSSVSAWPTEEQWNVVVNETGNLTDPIADYTTTGSSSKIQIVGNSSYPSAYMFNDGTYLSFRMRMLGDPTKTGKDYLDQGNVWGVEFDTDGNSSNYEYILVFSGGQSAPEIDFYENNHGGTIGSPGDTSTAIIWSVILTSGNWTYFRVVDAPDIFQLSADNNTFVEWRMPYDIFQNHTNLTNESSMRLIFGTSRSNGNLAGDIAASSLDGADPAATVADSVSSPVSTTGTVLTNGSVEFVADISGSGNISSINVTDTIYVKVNDSDRNTDSLSNQTLNVILLTGNGDNETITLSETGNDTGIYTGSILSENTTVGIGDGTLQVLDDGSGSFNVTYNDSTTDGTYVLRIDNATVNDTTLPTISYNPTTTENNSELNISNFIIINFTAYDLNLANVSVNIYNSTGSLLNSTNIACSPTTCTNQGNYERSNGVYLFNVTAYDTSGNSNTTPTRTVTVNLTSGSDLQLTTQNITFVYDTGETAEVTEAGEARENINLTINATVYNQGASASGTFYVLFYDGSSEFYNVSMNSIAGSNSANATAYWTTLAGTHNITIKVDPAADSSDTDFSNNNASKLINVSAWQKYYGNATGNRILANSLATSMNNWTWDNETNIGYLYVVNTSASINWSALHPLGYNSSNIINTTGQDFQDADTNLGMVVGTGNATGFGNNNITDLFTNTSGSNYGNIAIDKASFVIFGNTIDNVPIVNATDMTNHNAIGSANFVTGILWDDTKDSNGYYDTTENEDLIFITKIRQAASGLNGLTHNYEVAVPHTLNSITEGNVDLYMELI